MMKMRRFLSLLSVMMLMLLVCMTAVSCSNNFKKVPQTGFVTHHVKNGDSHIPVSYTHLTLPTICSV